MAATVATLYHNRHRVDNERESALNQFRLWLRDDGTCSYASVSDVEEKVMDDEDEDEYDKDAPYGQITYEVSWGRYELKFEPEMTPFVEKVECKWAQRWQSHSYYDRRSPPSHPSPWKQSGAKLSTIDLDCGPPGTTEWRTTEEDATTASQLGSTLGLAEQTPHSFSWFPSWPPADLTTKVITLATDTSTAGTMTVTYSDVSGAQGAVADLDPQTHTCADLRASIAHKMELDFHQLKMVLPDATLLEVSEDQSVLAEVFRCG